MPQSEPLSKENILEIIFNYDPISRSRKRAVMALNALAKFAQLDIDLKRYKGEYSPKKVLPRDLPSDELIIGSIPFMQ